jgi:hypothetical protein
MADHVGSVENAVTVLSRVHRGERRLIFSDSRARVEELASGLRRAGVRTFVSHGSLSADERRQAEAAFAAEPDCAIGATSTLELGIYVGDLDRVIQVGAPPSVASFLQRMGRSGRGAGTEIRRGSANPEQLPPLPVGTVASRPLAQCCTELAPPQARLQSVVSQSCIAGRDTASRGEISRLASKDREIRRGSANPEQLPPLPVGTVASRPLAQFCTELAPPQARLQSVVSQSCIAGRDTASRGEMTGVPHSKIGDIS